MSLLLLKKQKGSTLIEIIGALAITAGLILAASQIDGEKSDSIKNQNTAQFQSMVATAASLYVRDNYAAVLAGATASTPYKITLSNLIPTYIPSSFSTSATNPFGQTPCALILKPSGTELVGLVLTEGGADIPGKSLSLISSQTGPAGGYIGAALPLTATGSHGGWSVLLASYIGASCSGTPAGSNHLATAMFFDNNTTLQNFAYRKLVGGHAEANKFTTPIIFNSNTVIYAADSCTGYALGAIINDSNGNLLVCKGSPLAWASVSGTSTPGYWEDPVADSNSLGTCSAANKGHTKTPRDAYMPYTCDGVSWNPLFLDKNISYPSAYSGKVDVVASNLHVGNGPFETNTDCGESSSFDYGGGKITQSVFGVPGVCAKKTSGDTTTYNRKFGSYGWGDPVATEAALFAITTDPVGYVRIPLDKKYPYMWNGSAWSPINTLSFAVAPSSGVTSQLKDISTASCAGSGCTATATCVLPYAKVVDGLCSGDSKGIGAIVSTAGWSCLANSVPTASVTTYAFCKL